MAARRWDVWSVDRKDCSGLVVVEGVTEKAAQGAADTKNGAAARQGMAASVAFVALPQGPAPTWDDLPPLPASNEQPLHGHPEAEMAVQPWTRDTLAAHLHFLHGVDNEHVARASLAALAEAHRRLNHGPDLKTALIDSIEAGLPSRTRQESMELGPCEHHEGELALQLWGRTLGTQVCLTATDRARLAALLLPESEGLRALKDIWSANLGPGGRGAVEAGHAAGYRLGVDDMEHVHSELTEAERVQDFLVSLYETAGNEADRKAIDRVRDLLEKLRAAHG